MTRPLPRPLLIACNSWKRRFAQRILAIAAVSPMLAARLIRRLGRGCGKTAGEGAHEGAKVSG